MSNRLCFSYLAFSTPGQAEGRSTERQDSAAEVWAELHGFRLAPSRQYRDEGVSRFHGEARMKGALSRFLGLCGTDAVPQGSVLVIEDFDRLSRECPDDAWELFRQILLAGVEIVVLSLGRWFKRETLNDLGDRVFIQCCQHRAHQESAMKSKRIADIWADRRRRAAAGKGVCINPPSWIRRSDRGSLELVPERAETIRLMVRLVQEGLGTHRVAGELSDGPHARPCWLRNGRWSSVKVQHILLTPAVWGGYQPGRRNDRRLKVPAGELVEGFYPAILTREEAEALRRLISGRRNHKGRPCKKVPGLLTRLVRDAETGLPLWMASGGSGPDQRSLSRNWMGRLQVVAPYAVVESLVLRCVHEWVPGALVSSEQRADKTQAAYHLTQLARIAADREAIQGELSRPGRAASTVAILAGQLDELAAQEAEAKEAIADLDVAGGSVNTASLRDCQSLASRYASVPDSEKAAVASSLNGRLREILDGVWVYRRNFSARTGELIVQIWPRAGEMKECRVFLGKPPADFRPLDVGGTDFRKGYPSPLPDKRRAKKSSV